MDDRAGANGGAASRPGREGERVPERPRERQRDDDAPPRRAAGAFEQLLKIRYVAAVVVVLAVLHALCFLVMGARTAVEAYHHVLTGGPEGAAVRPGLELLHSLDFLLVALVLIILALGVAKLFLLRPGALAGRRSSLPSWLDVDSFGELKLLLWETILVALLVVALSSLTAGLSSELRWNALVLPAAILLLAVSLFCVKRA